MSLPGTTLAINETGKSWKSWKYRVDHCRLFIITLTGVNSTGVMNYFLYEKYINIVLLIRDLLIGVNIGNSFYSEDAKQTILSDLTSEVYQMKIKIK